VNKLIAALALLALTGCTTCQKHPAACMVGFAVLSGAIVASQHGQNRSSGVDGRDYTILPVNCESGACK
jgi:hypothetical protein